MAFPSFQSSGRTRGQIGLNVAPRATEVAQGFGNPQVFAFGNLLHEWKFHNSQSGAKLTTQGFWQGAMDGTNYTAISTTFQGGAFIARSPNGHTHSIASASGYGWMLHCGGNSAPMGIHLGTTIGSSSFHRFYSNTTISSGSIWAAISCSAQDVVQINTGTANAFRDLKLRNLIGTGNLATGTVAKSADYTATTSDGTIEVDASGAASTITLFAASGNAGKIIVVKKTDSSANAVTIDGNASETIDGVATISLASQYSTAILQVNAAGTGWNKLGGV